MNLGRTQEARQTLEQALTRKLENLYLHTDLYWVAFLQGDQATMQQRWIGPRAGRERKTYC